MPDPSLALQALIRARLIGSADLLALIPAGNIIDTNGRPEVVPAILLGEGQTTHRRFSSTTFAVLHVWIAESGLTGSKMVAGIIGDALLIDAQVSGAVPVDGFTVHDMRVTQTQFMRDPHANYSHAAITVAAIVQARKAA